MGVLTYAGYVLIFPGVYGLGAQVGQFRQIDQSFEHEETRFASLLSPARVSGIVDGRTAKAKRRYWKLSWLTVLGYAIAIGAGIAAAGSSPRCPLRGPHRASPNGSPKGNSPAVISNTFRSAR